MLARQAVETHVLVLARAAGGVERIGHAVLRGHAAPHGFRILRGVAVDGQTALVELLAVFEHVLAHLAEVDVKVAAHGRGIVGILDKGVHEPKLDVLDIGIFKIARFQFAHHAAPAGGGIGQMPVFIEVGVEVIRTALVGIESKVEHVEGIGLLHVDALVGEELALVDLAHPRVGKLCEVVFQVARRER